MEAQSSGVVEVEDLDPVGVLARIADAERRDREVQREKLRLAYQWCMLHPATSESGTATWGDARLPGLSDCDASLGGDGTPGVAPFVAEELGAAMGVSTQSAMSLMADALDLRHRFPQLRGWSRPAGCALEEPAGERPTPAPAFGRALGRRTRRPGRRVRLPTIERLVALAAARLAPRSRRGAAVPVRPRHADPPAPG